MNLLITNARVLTLSKGARPRRGSVLGELGVLDRADVLIEGGRIARVGASADLATAPGSDCKVIDAGGRVLMPAFVDCHTHACWAGDRLDEWELKQRGATYLELLQAGGGIMATVRAVRGASQTDLRDGLLRRLGWMLREGTTVVEIKSGYGLSAEHELKMLRAITDAGDAWEGTVVPTACIGHAIDPDAVDFINTTINETLPAVSAEFPGVTIDAYCEDGAWSLADCLRLFDRAMELGHPIRVHADQFNSLGMIPEAVRRIQAPKAGRRLPAAEDGLHHPPSTFRSIDHLEATTPQDLQLLAGSDLFGVMLPCSGFHVDGRYGDGRAFVDAAGSTSGQAASGIRDPGGGGGGGGGGALAIATNCNPGSAPTSSIPMAIALAVRNLGLTAAEAIAACTVNAATLLDMPDRGVIQPGAKADLVLLRWADERQLGYEFGGNPVDTVICNGQLV
jgi:imidazolonepropionase